MSPRRRVLFSALVPGSLLLVMLAGPVQAQFYDATRQSLDFTLDAIERSPSLLGMGRLTYVGDDPHQAITLWDFAANPVGIYDADTLSTVEIFPGVSSMSSMHAVPGADQGLERQDRAGRENRAAFEVWRRLRGRTAYGFAGSFGSIRADNIVSDDTECRSNRSRPTVMPAMVGHLPFLKSKRWLYSVRLYYAGEGTTDEYRSVFADSLGQYIDKQGTAKDPPDLLTPTDYTVETMGGGIGLGYDHGSAFRAALTLDGTESKIEGKNEKPRHSFKTSEDRPYRTGQFTMVGKLGRSLAWGVDGRAWRSNSYEDWFFSVSAGVGADPLTGRGLLRSREERGTAMRTRLSWKRGPLEVGGGLATRYSKITITAPEASDRTSFNYFRNVVYYRQGADSISLADSVSGNRSEYRSWEAGGGVAWRLPRNRGLLGVEFHRQRGQLDQVTSGHGPGSLGWDLRAGVEYRCTPVLMARAGYVQRWLDRDEYTEQNEYAGPGMTLGIGISPARSKWVFEAGYAIDWMRADYGTPLENHSGRQQLASQLRWAF